MVSASLVSMMRASSRERLAACSMSSFDAMATSVARLRAVLSK
jgi:hypothetical protein